jgi:ABC-type amino acid transport substrate-binding protein
MANAVGTTDFEDLARLQVYIVLYALIALFLSLWVLPALVCALTPLRYGDVMRALRTPLITAFATGSAMIVLPLLIEQCKRLIADTKMFGVEAQEQADASVKTLIPTAFTFPSAASLLVLSFVLFAGWYIGSTISVGSYPILILAGVPSLFGGSLLTVPFLLDLLRLPNDLFQLFLAVDVINSRFGTLLATMYYASIGLLGSIAMMGRVHIHWHPLTRLVLISTALITTTLLGVRAFYTHVVVAPYTKADTMKRLNLMGHPQPATVYTDESETLARRGQGPAGLAEIKDRGILRVCYFPKTYPSAFFNTADPPQLVGFDIEMAHRFARRIELPIEFLPVSSQVQAAESLDAGTCDILMVSFPISVITSQRFAMTSPTYNSPVGAIVRDHRRDSFRSWNEVRQRGAAVRVAVPAGPDSISNAKSLLPEATLVPVSTTEQVKRILESGAQDLDAILHVAENGAALTLLYPEFSVVVPTPSVFIPVGYSVAHGNDELLKTLNAWLGEQKAHGTVDELYRYWMLGQAAKTDKPPRWSVIRDVLGWVN